MLKAYKYRIYPTEEQQMRLTHWFGCSRFIFNLGLETKTTAWLSARKTLTCIDLCAQLTELKKGIEWLRDPPSHVLQMALRNLDNAYTKFFKGSGFPKYKKKKAHQSIQVPVGAKADFDKKTISFPKIGEIVANFHREFGGQPRTTTISKTPTGKYFVSFLIQDGAVAPEQKPIQGSTAIGMDVGLKVFATLSDGAEIENPRYLQSELRKLKIAQRTLARRYKKNVPIKSQSKGYHKQKQIVATIHERIRNKRLDFLHKTSTAIIKQYDTICVEDLNVKGMMQNRKLSKPIQDASWAEFFRMLQYKAECNGKNIVTIGAFAPSSKYCSNCGAINKELRLSDREWICVKCQTRHDRDVNAAKNIKTFGLKAKPSPANVTH